MLSIDYKEQAVNDLQKIDEEYKAVLQKTILSMERLHDTRMISIKTIQYIENYMTGLINQPKNYKAKMTQIKAQYIKFLDTADKIQKIEKKNVKNIIPEEINATGIAGTAGVLGGTAIANLGPKAAMAVAMTFGTASTGTAITSLSGAAATNAALAWLGGGAMAAGSAGIAGGQALLSLFGPIGWVIGGASLMGSMLAVNMSNVEITRCAEESIAAIKKEMDRIQRIDNQVLSLNNETKQLLNLLTKQLSELKRNRKKDYTQFTRNELNEFSALMNSTEILSKKLVKTIS